MQHMVPSLSIRVPGGLEGDTGREVDILELVIMGEENVHENICLILHGYREGAV